MKSLAQTLAFEISNLASLKTKAEIEPALCGIADRIITKINPPDPQPSTEMVAEIICEEMLRMEKLGQMSPRQATREINATAERIERYCSIYSNEIAKPLIGLPSNPFDDDLKGTPWEQMDGSE